MTDETIANSSQLDKNVPIRTLAGVPLVIVMDENNVKESDLYKTSTQLTKKIPIRAIDDIPLVIPLGMKGGWLEVYETWTYASEDDPTYILTIPGDLTGKYSAGMRVKLTQTTVKYFIITKVAYSSPNTTLTLYGGTDYVLVNATIVDPCYSMYKAPHGFPLSPTKWQVQTILTTPGIQNSPTQNTWYNLGSFDLDVPIGAWSLRYEVTVGVTSPDVDCTIVATLSKSSSASDDNEFTMSDYFNIFSDTNSMGKYANFTREKSVLRTAGATYYLLCRTLTTGMSSIKFCGSANYGEAVIKATCAYL